MTAGTVRPTRVRQVWPELQHPVVADPRARLVRGLQGSEPASGRLVVDAPAVRPAGVGGVGGGGEEDEPVRVGDRGNGVPAGEPQAGMSAAPGIDPLGGRGRRRLGLPQHDLDPTADHLVAELSDQ